MSTQTLPYDLLQYIIEYTDGHLPTLAACCLVNGDFRELAASALYFCLDLQFGEHLGPGRGIRRIQSVKKIPKARVEHALRSACLPYNRNRVRAVLLRGTYDEFPLGEEEFLYIFKQFRRLEILSFNVQHPRWNNSMDSDLFDETTLVYAMTLINSQLSLREVTLNDVANKNNKMLLSQDSLRKLALIDADDDIFDKFTMRLLGGLRELQIRVSAYNWRQQRQSGLNNVLHAITTRCHSLRSLTIGLIYMKTDEDREDPNETLFGSVVQIPHLEELCLEYMILYGYRANSLVGTNLQTDFPVPTTLKSLTVRFKTTREYHLDIPVVCRWMKHVVSSSPIERVSFDPFYQPRTKNPVQKGSWDILTDHLADKHASTLKSFDLRAAFVRKTAMKAIFRKCHQLEEFSVATSVGSLTSLSQFSANLPKLYKARFELRTAKGIRHQPRFNTQRVILIMQCARIRRLVVNDDEWEGAWVLENDDLKYHVRAVTSHE
ncbi:hypothetical protein PM082_017283 [Marasmius tenuissimus]|nr:hypothetical protein PM082_017283 [Marasmius tenuissimus]